MRETSPRAEHHAETEHPADALGAGVTEHQVLAHVVAEEPERRRP